MLITYSYEKKYFSILNLSLVLPLHFKKTTNCTNYKAKSTEYIMGIDGERYESHEKPVPDSKPMFCNKATATSYKKGEWEMTDRGRH